jgi:hypothetical protein
MGLLEELYETDFKKIKTISRQPSAPHKITKKEGI